MEPEGVEHGVGRIGSVQSISHFLRQTGISRRGLCDRRYALQIFKGRDAQTRLYLLASEQPVAHHRFAQG
jgi:hypothetical protein